MAYVGFEADLELKKGVNKKDVLKLRNKNKNYGLRNFKIKNNYLDYDDYYIKSYYEDELKFLKDIEPFLKEKSTFLTRGEDENYPEEYIIKNGKWHEILLIKRVREKPLF